MGLLTIGGALAFAAGCAPLAAEAASPAQPKGIGASHRASAPPEPEAALTLEGVHAERIALRSDDAHHVAKVVEEVLGLKRRRSPDADVRSVYIETRSNELVVFGTDRGIARVRALLSPGLIAEHPAGEPFASGAAAATMPTLSAVGKSEP